MISSVLQDAMPRMMPRIEEITTRAPQAD